MVDANPVRRWAVRPARRTSCSASIWRRPRRRPPDATADIGGIIIIDYRYAQCRARSGTHQAMQGFSWASDCAHTILPLSKFGLMQITRQRVRPEPKVIPARLPHLQRHRQRQCHRPGHRGHRTRPGFHHAEPRPRQGQPACIRSSRPSSKQSFRKAQRKWYGSYHKWIPGLWQQRLPDHQVRVLRTRTEDEIGCRVRVGKPLSPDHECSGQKRDRLATKSTVAVEWKFCLRAWVYSEVEGRPLKNPRFLCELLCTQRRKGRGSQGPTLAVRIQTVSSGARDLD